MPLTPEQRVNILFKQAARLGLEYPTDQMWIEVIHDAEFDTLNFPSTIAERHEIPFTWRKEVKLDKSFAADEMILEEEILDQLVEESNLE